MDEIARQHPSLHVTYDELHVIANLAEDRISTRYPNLGPADHYFHLQYALKNTVLELRLSYNASADRRHPPQLILDEYIEVEHSIVEAWNLSRLGGVVLRITGTDVPNVLYSFPIRGAATDLSKSAGFRFQVPNFRFRLRITGTEYLAAFSDAPIGVAPHYGLNEAAIGGSSNQGRSIFFSDNVMAQCPSVGEATPYDFNETAIGDAANQLGSIFLSDSSMSQITSAGKQMQSKENKESEPDNDNQVDEPSKRRIHFGIPGAPSCNIPFKDTGNITIAEVLAFLPEWIKSRDMINRILSNGGLAGVVTKILMAHRSMPQGFTSASNMILKRFNRYMRVVYGKTWKPRNHEIPAGHDEYSIDVSSFRTKIELEGALKQQKGLGSRASTNPVAFKDLAQGILKLPTGSDALDLTRCVQYHMDNPDESWTFPNDFQELLNHIGGPLPVTEAHCDRAIFARYNDTTYGVRQNYTEGSTSSLTMSSSIQDTHEPEMTSRSVAKTPVIRKTVYTEMDNDIAMIENAADSVNNTRGSDLTPGSMAALEETAPVYIDAQASSGTFVKSIAAANAAPNSMWDSGLAGNNLTSVPGDDDDSSSSGLSSVPDDLSSSDLSSVPDDLSSDDLSSVADDMSSVGDDDGDVVFVSESHNNTFSKNVGVENEDCHADDEASDYESGFSDFSDCSETDDDSTSNYSGSGGYSDDEDLEQPPLKKQRRKGLPNNLH